jgi:hypothetical protein
VEFSNIFRFSEDCSKIPYSIYSRMTMYIYIHVYHSKLSDMSHSGEQNGSFLGVYNMFAANLPEFLHGRCSCLSKIPFFQGKITEITWNNQVFKVKHQKLYGFFNLFHMFQPWIFPKKSHQLRSKISWRPVAWRPKCPRTPAPPASRHAWRGGWAKRRWGRRETSSGWSLEPWTLMRDL